MKPLYLKETPTWIIKGDKNASRVNSDVHLVDAPRRCFFPDWWGKFEPLSFDMFEVLGGRDEPRDIYLSATQTRARARHKPHLTNDQWDKIIREYSYWFDIMDPMMMITYETDARIERLDLQNEWAQDSAV